MIRAVGPAVNLGNVAASDVIGVQTLRRGLRGDTLLDLTTGGAGSPLRSRAACPSRSGRSRRRAPPRPPPDWRTRLPRRPPPHPSLHAYFEEPIMREHPRRLPPSRSPLVILDEAMDFYVFGLGANWPAATPTGSRWTSSASQLVCICARTCPPSPVAYPATSGSASQAGGLRPAAPLGREPQAAGAVGPELRFEGTAEQHRTIFLADPSKNVLEFKNYDDPRLQY